MTDFTVRDLFKLETMKDFKIVAGAKGLNKPIKGAEILDFEFTQGARMGRDSIFEGESVVLTSLLFAKEHPELILDAVKRLKEFNVSAIAYKTAIFDKLPEDVIEFADRENLPILEFGGDEFFERVIFDIMSAINREEAVSRNTSDLRRLIDGDMPRKQVRMLVYDINPDFRKYAVAVNVRDLRRDITKDRIFAEVSPRLREKTSVIKYEDTYMLILTQDEDDSNKFDALLADMYAAYDIIGDSTVVGISRIRPCRDNLDILVREAIWSRIVAEISEEKEKRFKNIGMYQFIAPNIENEAIAEFTDRRMQIIFDLDKEAGDEFFGTAVAYVKAGGDVGRTSELTYCHKNTVRYRLRKIQEKFELEYSDKEFYQELSFAVKAFLFRKKIEE